MSENQEPQEDLTELAFEGFTFGHDAIQVVMRQPNGVYAQVTWEYDAHDREILQFLVTQYDEKVLEKLQGRAQSWISAKPDFEPS